MGESGSFKLDDDYDKQSALKLYCILSVWKGIIIP